MSDDYDFEVKEYPNSRFSTLSTVVHRWHSQNPKQPPWIESTFLLERWGLEEDTTNKMRALFYGDLRSTRLRGQVADPRQTIRFELASPRRTGSFVNPNAANRGIGGTLPPPIFKSAERNGEWRFYSDAGKLAVVGNYSFGLKQGLWEQWEDNGDCVWAGVYVSDQLVMGWKSPLTKLPGANQIVSLKSEGNAPKRIAFSPDNARIALAYPNRIQVFDVQSGGLLKEIASDVSDYDDDDTLGFNGDGNILSTIGVSNKATKVNWVYKTGKDDEISYSNSEIVLSWDLSTGNPITPPINLWDDLDRRKNLRNHLALRDRLFSDSGLTGGIGLPSFESSMAATLWWMGDASDPLRRFHCPKIYHPKLGLSRSLGIPVAWRSPIALSHNAKKVAFIDILYRLNIVDIGSYLTESEPDQLNIPAPLQVVAPSETIAGQPFSVGVELPPKADQLISLQCRLAEEEPW
ncbi:MAG: hypothetical protein ACKN85_02910, partial [Pirellula sp.]